MDKESKYIKLLHVNSCCSLYIFCCFFSLFHSFNNSNLSRHSLTTRLYDSRIDAKNIEISSSADEGLYQLPYDLPNVFINQDLIGAAQQRLSQSPNKYPLTHAAYQDIKEKADNFYSNASLSEFPVYTGFNIDEYNFAVQNGLNPTLYLAIVCAVENKQQYCQKAINFIRAWAEKKGGTRLGNENHNLRGAGLNISRYIFRYAQAFHLVSPHMSDREKKWVKKWLLELGYQIKKSHQAWQESPDINEPNNHISWQMVGMLVASLYGQDVELFNYMMKESDWNYYNLVRDAIYESNNPHNIFPANRSFSHLPIQTRTGEMFDRHRSLPHYPAREDIYNRRRWWNEDVRQRVGFAYSTFSLEALMLTAHIAQLNNIYYNGQRPIDIHNHSIHNALQFYGQYYIDYPVGRQDCQRILEIEISPNPYDNGCPITYEPYFGEKPNYQSLYLFLLSKQYYPEDRDFYDEIISANITELIPDRMFHPLHTPVSVFTFFFAEN